ncbi:hypothetical protein [Chroococcidiopsis sp. CCNUC1]|uniref:hypothetical protein n=1 Tax=Chroococcidiopsis sp. CCNUC1 TaxID=2653189 RepID=UPI0020216425|nr:hypothetical protein [Chroococcidiopsis sp. CCNUC1]URD50746.1 hypothetical protein M5J74_01875 [Chroococcidiopsis sp. CCNUC1]
MSRGSSPGNTPKRFEAQIPHHKRDPKTNWGSGANLKFESDTGGNQSGEYKVPKEEI